MCTKRRLEVDGAIQTVDEGFDYTSVTNPRVGGRGGQIVMGTFVRPSAWVSCAERLPEECVDVIAFDPTFYDSDAVMTACYIERNGWSHESGSLNPTHWMPLPEPPKPEVKT